MLFCSRCCSSESPNSMSFRFLLYGSGFAGHAESAFADDVFLDLIGAAADDEAEEPHVVVLPGAVVAEVFAVFVEDSVFAEHVDGEAFERVAEFGTLELDYHGGEGFLNVVDVCAEEAEIVETQGHDFGLEDHKAIAVDGVVNEAFAVDGFFFHKVYEGVEA